MSHSITYESWTFPADKIKSGNLYLATSLLSSSLEVSSLVAEVECGDSAILDFQRNAKLLYYAEPDRPMVFRVQSIKRIGPSLYEISATSTLGLLSEGQHMGGVYTGQTAEEIILDICGTVPVKIKNILKKIKLYGWLPIAAPRDNLAQVLFAIGAALKTDLDGVLRVETLWDGISGQVPQDNMYTDANVDYSARITQVIITEHQYVPWTEEKQLFEGTVQAGDIITFDEPMHSLAAEGFTIQASGANWARVSAGSGTLIGKAYLHNTRQVSKAVQTASTPNVKTVENATLVSLVNAQAVADRLALYYRCREQVDASVVYQGESPGDRLATYHPFDKVGVDACLESADITLSNTLKAQEKSLVGYIPPQAGEIEYYDKWEIFTSDGEFIVPEGTTSVRAFLVGGGDGGASGEYGEPAKSPIALINNGEIHRYWEGVFGKGGKGGSPGKGGKVLTVDVDVEPGSTIIYKIGKGGKGGVKSTSGSVSGSLGGDTIFGLYSSKNGVSSSEGTIIPVINITCSGDGRTGITGGHGSGVTESQSEVYKPTITLGESITDYYGNVWNAGYPNAELEEISVYFGWPENGVRPTNVFSRKGHGGGAAVGRNGSDGDYGSIVNNGNFTGYAYTGTTGKGADATTPIKAQGYGKGGDGGHGGGGEGGSGMVGFAGTVVKTINLYIGTMSGPGKGSDGADGADGCLILFYRAPKDMNAGQLVDKNNKMVLDRLGRRIIM